MGARTLAALVVLRDPAGEVAVLRPGAPCPEWAADLVAEADLEPEIEATITPAPKGARRK